MRSEFIVPLGVSAAVPSSGRHFASVALVAETFVVLFDCGEGTQFQLAAAGIRSSKIKVVAITHLHGDHYLGLPGLLSTMAMQHRTEPLYIIAPDPLADVLDAMPGIGRDRRPFEVRFKGIADDFTDGHVLSFNLESRAVQEDPGFVLHATALDHSVNAYGYRFEGTQRPGRLDVGAAAERGITDHADFRKLKSGERVRTAAGEWVQPDEVVSAPLPGSVMAYVSDSRPCTSSVRLARGANLLYHEATFMDEDIARAMQTGHSTAREAGEVARDAGVGRLVLGHFSARYPEATVLEEEALTAFSRVDAAVELARYYLDGSDHESDSRS